MRRFRVIAAAIAICISIGTSVNADLFVDVGQSEIHRLDETTFEDLGVFVKNENYGSGMAFGPDGNLYLTDEERGQVVRVDGKTGKSLGVFAEGIDVARDLAFGPNGDLYVGALFSEGIYRIDGKTGKNLGLFATAPDLFPEGITFGPNGDLFVRNSDGDIRPNEIIDVLRFDGTTGALLGGFTSGVKLSPVGTVGLVFGPDGNLYLSDDQRGILRFDGVTGAFIDEFVSGNFGDLAFDPNGNLVALDHPNIFPRKPTIDRFSGSNGLLIDKVNVFGSPGSLAFTPVPEPSVVAVFAFLACLLRSVHVHRKATRP